MFMTLLLDRVLDTYCNAWGRSTRKCTTPLANPPNVDLSAICCQIRCQFMPWRVCS